jgi:hypothetical protein
MARQSVGDPDRQRAADHDAAADWFPQAAPRPDLRYEPRKSNTGDHRPGTPAVSVSALDSDA